jgi:hypothetical protein
MTPSRALESNKLYYLKQLIKAESEHLQCQNPFKEAFDTISDGIDKMRKDKDCKEENIKELANKYKINLAIVKEWFDYQERPRYGDRRKSGFSREVLIKAFNKKFKDKNLQLKEGVLRHWNDWCNGAKGLFDSQIKTLEDLLGIEHDSEYYTESKPVSSSQEDISNLQQNLSKPEDSNYNVKYIAILFYKDNLAPPDSYLARIYKRHESCKIYDVHEAGVENFFYIQSREITNDDHVDKSPATFGDCIFNVFNRINKDKSLEVTDVLVEFFVPQELFHFDWGCLEVLDKCDNRLALGKLYPFVIRPLYRLASGQDCVLLVNKHKSLVGGCGKWIVNGYNLLSFKNKKEFVAIKQIEPPSDLGKWHNEVVKPMVPLAIWWFPYEIWPKIDGFDMMVKNPSAFLDYKDCEKLLKGDHGDQLQYLANYDKILAALRHQLFDNSAGKIDSVNYAARNLVIYVDHPDRPPPSLSGDSLHSFSPA